MGMSHIKEKNHQHSRLMWKRRRDQLEQVVHMQIVRHQAPLLTFQPMEELIRGVQAKLEYVYEKLPKGNPWPMLMLLCPTNLCHNLDIEDVSTWTIYFPIQLGLGVMMYVLLDCCVHDITCMCAFSWVCGGRLHCRLAQNATSSTPSLKGIWCFLLFHGQFSIGLSL